jgi:hypothetical protein
MISFDWSYLRSRIGLIFILAIIIVLSFFPAGWDWIRWYRPGCLALLAGESPYQLEGFFNPPWVLLPLIPLAFLPERVGVAVMTMAYLGSFIFVARKLGGKPLTIFLMMTTPNFLFYGLSFANIDWMVMLGLIMPPQIGLFFVMAKPQIGLGIAIFWLFESYQQGKFIKVIKDFAPVTIAFIISFLLYGLWPLRPLELATNTSLWPMSIPIGLVLLSFALRKGQKGLAILSSPFLSPFVGVQSWPVALLGLLPHQIESIMAVAGMWAIYFITTYSG